MRNEVFEKTDEKTNGKNKRKFLIEPVDIQDSEQFVDKVLDYSIAMKQFEFISLFLRNTNVFIYPENILNSIKKKIKEYSSNIYFYEDFVSILDKALEQRDKPIKYGEVYHNILEVDEVDKFIKYHVGNALKRKQFEFVSLLLRNVPVDWFPSPILICLLEETSQFKKLIPYRYIFWLKTQEMINKRGENYNYQMNIIK